MTDDVYQRAVEERDALRARLASLEARLTTRPQPQEAPMTPEEPIADKRRRERQAASWRRDEAMEGLLRQIEHDPNLALTPGLRLQVGYYQVGQAAAAEQRIKENRRS